MTSYFAREDSNSANNPALNLTGDAAREINFVATPGGGDVFLETDGGGPDPDTLVEIEGQTYNFTYEFQGEMPTAKRDGSQQVPDQFEGHSVVVITVQDYPAPGETTRLMFLPESNATQADMDSFGNGAIDVQALDEDPPPMAVCFVRGTRIATPEGERPIETLREGDFVLTSDGRPVELKWVSYSHFPFRDLVAEPNLRPVCIPRDWLGRGMPHSDLWVSPQHRIVLRGWRAELNLGREAVFVPAKHLMGEPGHPGPDWFGGVDYFHLLCEGHEILLSNGLESESFFPGDEARVALDAQARKVLETLLKADENGVQTKLRTALSTATAKEALLLRPATERPRRMA